MGSTKHEKSFIDFDKSYEQNVIGLSGIVYFGIGLFFLIVISFGLMWALQNVLEDYAVKTKDVNSPLMMSDKDRLPPEPRLQSAPGFKVESPNGPINLELQIPQAEYRTLQGLWNEEAKNGQKTETVGSNGEKVMTVVTLPINEAKEKFLQANEKNAAGATDETLNKSRMILSDSSSGRVASEKRR